MGRKLAHPTRLALYVTWKLIDAMSAGGTNVKIVSITCTVVFLACLLSLSAIRYMGGLQCMPLVVPPLLPAEVIRWGVGFVITIVLVGSLAKGRDRKWPLRALAVLIVTTIAFWFFCQPTKIFLYGLRDRFIAQVGYPSMRQFAQEFSANDSLPTEQKQWDDLATRYPFLRWNRMARARTTRQGAVEVYWGGALMGHWGFEVAGEGTLSVPDKDEGRVLKVADDIQFFYLYD
ncbi:MAG: hypothetical protein JSW66_09005 [Phycisphaerales bacterium]|nr:MAG: hypothetical protein JSW66_09005 [Phycisphaerales bacterium]